jgi:hypothetical protein
VHPLYNRRKKQKQLLLVIVLLLLLLLILWISIKNLSLSPSQEAKNTVYDFYSYEQDGDFASSWSLFHPFMKEKFPKGHYIQDRSHVFMNHFGVETFSFTLSDPKPIKDWKMAKGAAALKEGYVMTVVQTYKGKYGNFDLHQEVFAMKDKDKWRILWDYNQ